MNLSANTFKTYMRSYLEEHSVEVTTFVDGNAMPAVLRWRIEEVAQLLALIATGTRL